MTGPWGAIPWIPAGGTTTATLTAPDSGAPEGWAESWTRRGYDIGRDRDSRWWMAQYIYDGRPALLEAPDWTGLKVLLDADWEQRRGNRRGRP